MTGRLAAWIKCSCTREVGRTLLTLPLWSGAYSHADGIALQPKLSGGLQEYQLTVPSVIVPNGNQFRFQDGYTISDTLPFLGAGLTASMGRAFVDVSGQWSRTGTDHGEQFLGVENGGQVDTTGAVGFQHHFDARFSRHEINAALGWAFDPSFSLYAGYKSARLNQTHTESPDIPPIPANNVLLFQGDFDITVSYHGYFVGATYALPVKTWGALTVQSSVARLSGSYHQMFNGVIAQVQMLQNPPTVLLQPLNTAFQTSVFGGLSTGLNVGISWTGNFGSSPRLQGLSYTLGIDESQYKFSTSQNNLGAFEEKNVRERLELRYQFGL